MLFRRLSIDLSGPEISSAESKPVASYKAAAGRAGSCVCRSALRKPERH